MNRMSARDFQQSNGRASSVSSRSLQRGDGDSWRAREQSGYAAWEARTASASRSLQRDADGGYYGARYQNTPYTPYYANDALYAQRASGSRSLQRDAHGGYNAPHDQNAAYYASPHPPHDAYYAQYDHAGAAARGPSAYAPDSVHERTSRRDYNPCEDIRSRRRSRSRSPLPRGYGTSRPRSRSLSPPLLPGSSLQARKLPRSRSLQRGRDNVSPESPYARAQPSRVSVPQNSSHGPMPVGDHTTPGASVPLEPNQRDSPWGDSVSSFHDPYHFPPPPRLPPVATISLVAQKPVTIESQQALIDDLEHDKYSLRQEVDYLREVVKSLEEKAVDAMWEAHERQIIAQGGRLDFQYKRDYMGKCRNRIRDDLNWRPMFSQIQRYLAHEYEGSEDESDTEPPMVRSKDDDRPVSSVADQEPGEIAQSPGDTVYVDDSVHPHEEYGPPASPPCAQPPPPPPPRFSAPPRQSAPPQSTPRAPIPRGPVGGGKRPRLGPQPTNTDARVLPGLRLEAEDASYYDEALTQVEEHVALKVVMQDVDMAKLPQVNWNSPTKYDFMIQATNLPIPLGKHNQPFLPGWDWEDFDPWRLWRGTVYGPYVAPGSDLWKSLALQASSLPFEYRSPAQRMLACVAHIYVSSPTVPPLLPACAGETPEPNFRLLLQTNPHFVPHGVRRRYRVVDDILYTEWSVADVAIYLRIQMCRNPELKAKWPALVRKAVLWGHEHDREALESVPRTYHALGPFQGDESSNPQVFDFLASCAFTVPQMVDDDGVVYSYVVCNYRLFEIYQNILAENKNMKYENGVERMERLWRLMRPHFVEPVEHEPIIRFKVIK